MGFLCSYLMEPVALALPSKRTERGGILMTCGVHRKHCLPGNASATAIACQAQALDPGWQRCEQGPEDVPGREIPPLILGMARHLPHANCEASLGSGCKECEAAQGEPPRSTPVHTRGRCRLFSHSHTGGAAFWSIRVAREPARGPYRVFPLPDTRSAGRQRTARPIEADAPSPATHPRFEPHASSASAGEAPFCPTAGRSRLPEGGVPHRQHTVGVIQKVSFNISLPLDRRQHA